jgi:hypothetical protein
MATGTFMEVVGKQFSPNTHINFPGRLCTIGWVDIGASTLSTGTPRMYSFVLKKNQKQQKKKFFGQVTF